MASFVDEFMKNYGGEITRHMSSNFNVDPSTVKQLIPQLAPLIISGLKKQKDEQGGDERVDHILNKYGDSSVLDNIKDLISNKAGDASTDASLGGLLGNSGSMAAQVLGNQHKISAGTIEKMIPALAPLVLGALSRKRDTGGAGISGIGSMLDADGDGSILDDVAGFLTKGASRKGGGGILGGLLGGLIRPK
jgi:hypothetical protein